ncbi:unnamed protein product [Arctogadus glacialis]
MFYVAAAAIDIRPTTKGTVGSGNATSELSWAIPPPPYRIFAIRSVPHPAVETRHKCQSTRFHTAKFIVMLIAIIIIIIIVWLWNVPPLAEVV